MEREKITKKALEILLNGVESIENVDEIEKAIKDYEFEGFDLRVYNEKVKKLKECFLAIEEERQYQMAVLNFYKIE